MYEGGGAVDLSRAVWRKSSRSGGGAGQCVEVASVQDVTAVLPVTMPEISLPAAPLPPITLPIDVPQLPDVPGLPKLP